MTSDVKVPAFGPQPATILIVGEAPGEDEVEQLQPFVGASGKELTRMLAAAGIDRTQCRIANVVGYRPPGNDIEEFFYSSRAKAQKAGHLDFFANGRYYKPIIAAGLEELRAEIRATRPTHILAVGGTALWALTGNLGISKWRGSAGKLLPHLQEQVSHPVTVIATYHPAAILRQWEWRWIAVRDMKRLLEDPPQKPVLPNITYAPSSEEVMCALDQYSGRVAVDIETRQGHIVSISFFCPCHKLLAIPFVSDSGQSYYSPGSELEIVQAIGKLFRRQDVFIVGQYFSYDLQVLAARYGIPPPATWDDTMIAQHTLAPGTQKSLAFLASIYLPNYVYWKDEGREAESIMDLLSYNAKDALYTSEVLQHQTGNFTAELRENYAFLMKSARLALEMMFRGVAYDKEAAKNLSWELFQEAQRLEEWIQHVVGVPFNWRSPKQVGILLYEVFKLPLRRAPKGGYSTDDKALRELQRFQPLFAPILEAIRDLRSIGVLQSTFLESSTAADGRMRCSFNVAGTETFRWSASKGIFGDGFNLQTVPAGET